MRINKINRRKEFFKISLDDIRRSVEGLEQGKGCARRLKRLYGGDRLDPDGQRGVFEQREGGRASRGVTKLA